MDTDVEKWSGEGALTQRIVERLKELADLAFIRVEDAPASRSEADYNFISNEIYVGFRAIVQAERRWRFGVIPATHHQRVPSMSMGDLERTLTAIEAIGAPDYSDDRMMQYLRSERIVPPYQTRGYKLVELVRIYQVD